MRHLRPSGTRLSPQQPKVCAAWTLSQAGCPADTTYYQMAIGSTIVGGACFAN